MFNKHMYMVQKRQPKEGEMIVLKAMYQFQHSEG